MTAGRVVVVDNDRLGLAAVSANLLDLRGGVGVGDGWTLQFLALALGLRFGLGPLKLLGRRRHERTLGIAIVGMGLGFIVVVFVRRCTLRFAVALVGLALELLLDLEARDDEVEWIRDELRDGSA